MLIAFIYWACKQKPAAEEKTFLSDEEVKRRQYNAQQWIDRNKQYIQKPKDVPAKKKVMSHPVGAPRPTRAAPLPITRPPTQPWPFPSTPVPIPAPYSATEERSWGAPAPMESGGGGDFGGGGTSSSWDASPVSSE